MTKNKDSKLGLILSGGGARAAYQVGVLKAISHMLPSQVDNPFPVVCGTSAGAINAMGIACYASRFHEGVRRLTFMWKNLTVEQVYRADVFGILRNGFHWFMALMTGGLGRYNPQALFDRMPLRCLLERIIPFDEVDRAIESGALHALSITASGYSSGHSVTFFQAEQGITSWKRVRRAGCATKITLDHLMASSAIPFVFAPVKIHREYFGDGSMRQTAPLSPAIHLGADRVLIIGVAQETLANDRQSAPKDDPTLAQIVGHVLNSIFLDSLDADLERLTRINKTIGLIPENYLVEKGVKLRRVEPLVISPSEDLEKIAAKHAHEMPRAVRFLLRGLGALDRSGSNLVSYLLFDKTYLRELIDLGYHDAMKRKDELLEFINT